MLCPRKAGAGRTNPGLGDLGPPWKAYLQSSSLGVNVQARVRAALWNKDRGQSYNYHVDRAVSLVPPCLCASSCISRLRIQSNWPGRHRIVATGALGYTLATSICRSTFESRSSAGRLITL